MEHTAIRRELSSNLQWLLTHNEPLPHVLRPYQQETLASFAEWLSDPSGTRRSYVHHATGLGKTVLFATLSRLSVGLRLLIIVPSKVLVSQTARAIHQYVGGLLGHLTSMRYVADEQGEIICVPGHEDHSVVLTTDATLCRNATTIANDYAPHIVIRDECHWGYTPRSQRALGAFTESVIIGFTATPDYLGTVHRPGFVPVTLPQGITLYGNPDRFARTHFQTRIDRRTARWGMDAGYLCRLRLGQMKFDANLERVRIVDGIGGLDYDIGSLQRAMLKSWPVVCQSVADLYRDDESAFAERRAFAICTGVQAATELSDAVGKVGIPSRCIHGKTPDCERDAIFAAFDRGEIPLLTSVMVLREGWDSPNADVCFMLRPSKSRVFYEQAVGRTLRLPADRPSKEALVVDLGFSRSRFAPLSAPLIYGMRGEAYGGSDRQVIPERPEAQPKMSASLPERLTPPSMTVSNPSIEHWADKDDTFAGEGLTWASLCALRELYESTFTILTRVILENKEQIRQCVAKDAYRRLDRFYCLEDLKRFLGPPKVKPLSWH